MPYWQLCSWGARHERALTVASTTSAVRITNENRRLRAGPNSASPGLIESRTSLKSSGQILNFLFADDSEGMQTRGRPNRASELGPGTPSSVRSGYRLGLTICLVRKNLWAQGHRAFGGQGAASMANGSVVINSPGNEKPDNNRFIEELQSIVSSRHVLTKPRRTLRYRRGFRFGDGPVLAVVRPGNLSEQWRVLQACVASNKIIIVQAANTGLTGGSTPDGSDYDRDIVIVSTLRIAKIRLINEGRQVVCHSGSTLMQLERALKPLGREPHSVIGSTCIGASIVGGICNNSGGALIRRGPAYTQFALFARIDETGKIHLVNHLGINLGDDPQKILDALDRDAFTESDIDYNSSCSASDHDYAKQVRDFCADTPARFNADPKRLYEASGSAGKVMVLPFVSIPLPKTNKPSSFTSARTIPLNLPTSGSTCSLISRIFRFMPNICTAVRSISLRNTAKTSF